MKLAGARESGSSVPLWGHKNFTGRQLKETQDLLPMKHRTMVSMVYDDSCFTAVKLVAISSNITDRQSNLHYHQVLVISWKHESPG